MIIDKLLASTVKLYLRSQVDAIEDLQDKITAKDRQILKGELPQVFIAANAAVYEGIYLRQLELTGNNILFNLPEILERKPLKLLEPITVSIEASLAASDLQASLDSDLFLSGLADLWQTLLEQQVASLTTKLPANSDIKWQQITLQDNLVIMTGTLPTAEATDTTIEFTMNVDLVDAQTLVVTPLDIQGIPEFLSGELQPLKFDLGTEVAISHLSISDNNLFTSGKITISP